MFYFSDIEPHLATILVFILALKKNLETCSTFFYYNFYSIEE